MQGMKLGISTAIVLFLLGIGAGAVFFNSHDASDVATNHAMAQTVVSAPPAQWEYTAVAIDTMSLQAKLATMGVDGWEVISVTPTDAVVDTGHDGKMHVTTTRFEITGKRKRR